MCIRDRFETADRVARATIARFTQGVSPYAQSSALYDWAAHLARSPGRQTELWLEAVGLLARLGRFGLETAAQTAPEPPFQPEPHDRRFADPAWQTAPYIFWQQAFLAQEKWWRSSTQAVRGMSRKNADRVAFLARQGLDVLSPSNMPWLNPTIVERTREEAGANLMRGWQNLAQDAPVSYTHLRAHET